MKKNGTESQTRKIKEQTDSNIKEANYSCINDETKIQNTLRETKSSTAKAL